MFEYGWLLLLILMIVRVKVIIRRRRHSFAPLQPGIGVA